VNEVSEIDIEAWLDGELEPSRMIDVEDHLARNPQEAARVMADMRNRNALRLIARRDAAVSPVVRKSAERLDRRFRRRRMVRRLSVPTIAVAIVALGLSAPGDLPIIGPNASLQAAPTYLDDAIQSHRTTQLRASMISQPEVTSFDPADVMRYTQIKVPRLPVGWQIMDVQLFPSDEGPALQLSVRADSGQLLSIFAIRATSSAPTEPLAVRWGGDSIAYWKSGPFSYALTGAGTPEQLDALADRLEDASLS